MDNVMTTQFFLRHHKYLLLAHNVYDNELILDMILIGILSNKNQ